MFRAHYTTSSTAAAARVAVLDSLEAAVISLVEAEGKNPRIEAIKLVRSITNGGLKLSIEYVDAVIEKVNQPNRVYMNFGDRL